MEQSSHNVARHLRQIAQERPHVTAIKSPVSLGPDGHIGYHTSSFGELDSLSDAAARLFRSAGIAPGDHVLLALRPGQDLIVGMYGLLKAGGIPVALDPGMGLGMLLKCIAKTRPTALIGIRRATLFSHLPIDAFSSLKTRVTVGDSTWYRSMEAARSQRPGTIHEAKIEDTAAVLFTSGSTGTPKGVVYTHGMLDAQVTLVRNTFGITKGEIDLPLLPVFALFNPALGVTTVTPWMNPARPASADPEPILEAIQSERITTSFGSPTLWDILSRAAESRNITLSSLHRIMIAGAPVPPGLLSRLSRVAPNATVHTPYGATECLPVTNIQSAEILSETGAGARRGQGTCVGRPATGVEIRVIREEDGPLDQLEHATPCAPGEIGEILATGPTVTRNYNRNPEATALAKTVDAQGRTWHRMGDLGAIDERGRLWFHGRRAEKLETSDGSMTTESVEPSFSDHNDVRRCALIGLGPRGKQRAVLVVEPRRMPTDYREAKVLVDDLRHHASANRHSARVAAIVFQRALPTDIRHNAKIHRLNVTRTWNARGFVRDGDMLR